MKEALENGINISIFESTQVALNLELLTLMPSSFDISSFFLDIAEEMDLTFCEQVENGCPVFLGLWNNVLRAEKKLKDIVDTWQEKNGEIEIECADGNDLMAECQQNLEVSDSQEVLPNYNEALESGVGVAVDSDHSLYIVQTGLSRLVECPKLADMKSALTSVQETVEENQMILSNNKEDSTEIKDIYVDIALSPQKKISTRSKSRSAKFDIKSKSEQNPLDKLCQLLCIAEDEMVESRASSSKQRKKHEEDLPFRYFCDLCSFKAKRPNHLVKHAVLHEKIKQVLCCDQCDFKAIRGGALRRHMMTHSTIQLQCKFCGYKTDSKDLLIKHVQCRHGPSVQKKTKCNFCDFNAATARELQTHLRLFHEGERVIKLWKCSKCPYKSKLRAHLKRHENDKHGSLRQFLCHYCGQRFKRNDTLTQHKITHGEINKTFTCLECGKVCTSSVFLREHLASHTTERPFLCDVCGSSFKTQAATLRHKRAQHSGKPQVISCLQCSQLFANKVELNRHKKTHRLKTEIVRGPGVQAEITTPISIQVLYTEQLDPGIPDVTIK